jgi:hypothetical protein
MINFWKKPRTKNLEDLELLEINLIKDVPLEYAYLLPNSNRVIQKESKEAIMKIFKEDPSGVEYIKFGTERDFELANCTPELQEFFKKAKRKKSLSNLILNVLYMLLLVFYLIFNKDPIFSRNLFLWAMLLFLISNSALNIFRLIKLNNKAETHCVP